MEEWLAGNCGCWLGGWLPLRVVARRRALPAAAAGTASHPKCLPDPAPAPFFLFLRRSNLRVVTEVAKSLEFSPLIHAMADRIIEGMTAGGAHDYNGVHLRIEKDARDWAMIMGGQQVRLGRGQGQERSG